MFIVIVLAGVCASASSSPVVITKRIGDGGDGGGGGLGCAAGADAGGGRVHLIDVVIVVHLVLRLHTAYLTGT